MPAKDNLESLEYPMDMHSEQAVRQASVTLQNFHAPGDDANKSASPCCRGSPPSTTLLHSYRPLCCQPGPTTKNAQLVLSQRLTTAPPPSKPEQPDITIAERSPPRAAASVPKPCHTPPWFTRSEKIRIQWQERTMRLQAG